MNRASAQCAVRGWQAGLVLACLVPAVVTAQGSFIIRRAADTVAVERFNREPGLLTGNISQMTGVNTDYVITLRPDQTIQHVDLTRTGRQGNVATVSIDFTQKTAKATMSAGGQTETDEVTAETTLSPFLVVSFALSEQIARSCHLAAGQSVKLTAVRLGSGDTATMTVSRFHADSVSLTMADVGVKLAINARGEVVGGTHQSQPWIVERKP